MPVKFYWDGENPVSYNPRKILATANVASGHWPGKKSSCGGVNEYLTVRESFPFGLNRDRLRLSHGSVAFTPERVLLSDRHS